MAEITLRRRGEIVRALFGVLKHHPEGLSARSALGELEKVLPPTAFEQSEYPNHPGVRRYERIVRFTTIGPTKAGWMLKIKGTWTVTPEGLAAAASFPDDEVLFREVNRLYHQWHDAQPVAETHDEDAEDALPLAQVTLEEAEETARGDIREYLASMPPYDFQDLVATLLRAMGYHVPWVAPPGPDKGIDIVAFTDPLGANGPRIKVQVKRRQDVMRVHEVRAFIGLLGTNDVGIFVTTGRFTPDAETEARSEQIRRIQLVDGDAFIDLWVEHYDKIPEPAKQLLPLKPIYYLATG